MHRSPYTPHDDFHGQDSLIYVANDGTADSAGAVVTMTVNPMNDAPQVAPKTLNVDEDKSESVLLTGTDIDGDPLTFRITSAPQHGTVSLSGSTVTYAPHDDFHGTDTFHWVASDGTVDSATAAVSVTVNPVNDNPVAAPGSLTLNEGTSDTVLLSGTDIDGDSLTFRIVTTVQHGTAELSGNRITYTPDAHFNGSDSLTYVANDGTADSDAVTVTITVNEINDPPEADAKSLTTPEDVAGSVILTGSDPEGTALTFEIVRRAGHGELSLSGHQVTYSPRNNYHGSDAFTYVASDATGARSEEAQVTVTVNAVNDAPVVQPVTFSATEDTTYQLVLFGTDADGDSLTFDIIQPVNGTVTSGTTGSPFVSYRPHSHYFGWDSFSYTARDSHGGSATGTVSVTVEPVNDAPVATLANQTVAEDASKQMTLTATDEDDDPLTWRITGLPSHGTIERQGMQVTYQPDEHFNGTDSFTYEANDGQESSAGKTVQITVTPVNDPAEGAPVISGMNQPGHTLTADASAVTDIEGIVPGSVSWQWYRGSALIPGATSAAYLLSAADESQAVSAVMHFQDGGHTSETVTSNKIRIAQLNRAPVISGLPPELTMPAGVIYSHLPACSDEEGDVLTSSLSNAPSWLHVDPDSGELRGLPLKSHEGRYDNIILNVSDGQGNTTQATFSVVVSAPAAVDDGWAGTTHTALAGLTGAAAPTAPVVSQQLVGEIAGQPQVDGGAFHYSVPVSLPPGRRGMQPSVSLSYGSQGGQGNAGYGWHLSAGSAISRCSTTWEVDQDIRNVLMKDDDALCLDGQRLILLSETPGKNGAIYKTERNPDGVVTLSGGDVSSSTGSYFKWVRNNGQVNIYNQRFVPEGSTAPLTWSLGKQTDTFNNSVIYTYQTGTTFQLLTNIHYTGTGNTRGKRRVRFQYTEVAARSAYGFGYKTERKHRLHKIHIHTDSIDTDEHAVADDYYELVHNPDQTLADIRHCLNAGTQCTSQLKTDFDYYRAEGQAFVLPLNTAGDRVAYSHEDDRLFSSKLITRSHPC